MESSTFEKKSNSAIPRSFLRFAEGDRWLEQNTNLPQNVGLMVIYHGRTRKKTSTQQKDILNCTKSHNFPPVPKETTTYIGMFPSQVTVGIEG